MILGKLLLSFAAAAAGASHAGASHGVLLLAHGGNKDWNAEIASIAAKLDASAPTEIALGMADPAALQSAVDRLQKRGVERIVAVPLFIHSRSEVLDQTRYALGLREQPSLVLRDAMASMAKAQMAHAAHGGAPGHGAHGGHSMSFSLERVKASVPVTMAKALDDSPLVGDIAARRAKALSRAPEKETVLLVGHGPVDEAANDAWLRTMRVQAARVKKAGGYRDAKALTIRDDSPAAVKDPALRALREAVTQASRDGGRAIVVPYLIARGGIESHITQALEGLEYSWDGKTLCPDPGIETWAAKAAGLSPERPR